MGAPYILILYSIQYSVFMGVFSPDFKLYDKTMAKTTQRRKRDEISGKSEEDL